MTDLLSWFLAWRLPSTSLHCVIMQFGYVQKTRVLPSETLPPNLDIENFCHRVDHVNKTRRLSSLFTTPAMVDVVAIYYTMVNRNPLSPLLWFVVQLVPTVMQQLTRFRLSHCPSAVAKLLYMFAIFPVNKPVVLEHYSSDGNANHWLQTIAWPIIDPR